MLPTTRRRRIGSNSLHFLKYIFMKAPFASSETCIHDSHVGAPDLGSHCLWTLFYQFYKRWTSPNIIEFDQTPHDATPGLCLQWLNTYMVLYLHL